MNRLACLAAVLLVSCEIPECAQPAYDRPECRVAAENELAHLISSNGVEIRFQDPTTTDTDSWVAGGLVDEVSLGTIRARVATLGEFRLSLHGPSAGTASVRIELENVDSRIPPFEDEIEAHGLTRVLELKVGTNLQIEGRLPSDICQTGFTIAAVGDIQTNPTQGRRTIAALHDEWVRAEDQGKPLMGLLFLGDVSENSTVAQLEYALDIFRASPVPSAVVPGNHDVYNSEDAAFNRIFGPGTLSFDVCDAHFAMLDTGNAEIAASVEGRLPELLDVGDRQYLIAGMHHPPYAGATGGGWTAEDQAQHLLALLGARQADLLVAGHVHERIEFDAAPVRVVVVGTAGANQANIDPDYGYLRMEFDPEDGLSWCFVELPAPGSDGERSASKQPFSCAD
jgi:predicted phosphodiesterase